VAIVCIALAIPGAGATGGADSRPAPAPSCPPQDPDEPRARSRRETTAGRRYEASWLRRVFLGADYRQLWTTPIEAPVLDLDRWPGGMKAVDVGGSKQTFSLELEAGDGREYRFRSIDKEPSRVLPRALQGTLAASVVQDQTSSALPEAPAVVASLLASAGILHAPPRLMVLADSEGLGKHRAAFAGMLGMLEEVPKEGITRGFEGVSDVESSEDLFEKMARDPAERIDADAFAEARLVDMLVGDWDRHEGQWRWARSLASGRWLPVPRDRDQAFVRFDGLALKGARLWAPRLVDFGESYPPPLALGWNSRDLDRRLLGPVTREAWEEAARGLQRELDDAAVDRAVCELPPEHRELEGARLGRALRARRDRLPEAALAFYRMLAREAEVYGTSGPDEATVERQPDGRVRVRLVAAAEGSDAEPLVDRVFVPSETSEVRLHLLGGNDRVVTRGPRDAGIRVRVVGGDGADVLDDSAVGGVRFYDADERSEVRPGPGTRVDTRPWSPPREQDAPAPLDWGRRRAPQLWVTYYRELGVLVGAGFQSTRWGFREYPHASRQRARLGYSTGVGSFRFEYEGDFRRRGTLADRVELLGLASGFEVIRFHGYGNEREAPDPDSDYYRVEQAQYALSPAVVEVLAGGTLAVGPVVRFARTDLQPDRIVTDLRPYGIGDFGQVGARASFSLDARDRADAATRGTLVSVTAGAYPAAWSVASTFGVVAGSVAGYLPLPLPLRPSIAVRAGGRRLFGQYPFHEAAFLGGWDTVRGLARNRYAGDASVYLNGELRVRVARVNVLFQGDLGLFALADTGRVFYEGESSSRWHSGWGGGAWLSFEKGTRTFSATVATSEGRTAFYLHGGMLF
jgi:hypothetical protein